MNLYIRIYTGSAITIERIASIFEQEGIQSMIKDHMESGRLAGFGALPNDVELFVQESDLDNAKNLIQQYKNDLSSTSD